MSNWVQLALATPVALWAGSPFFWRGWASLKTRNLNMFTLIALGVGVAWTYSVVATLAPGLFPAAFRDAEARFPVYFEAAAVITTLVLIGQVLELRAREKTGGAIRALLDLAPKTARRLAPTGATRRSRSTPLKWATAYASGRAKKSRSTEFSSRALAPSTKSMVTGESMPVTKASATRRSAAPSTSPAPS